MRDAVTLEADPQFWLPVPPRSMWDAELVGRWIARTVTQALENARAEEGELDAVIARCRAVLERADASDQCVYLPVAAPVPVLCVIECMEIGSEWQSRLGGLHAGADSDPRVEVQEIAHQSLAQATRVMRIDVDPGGRAVATVAFHGTAGGVGVLVSAMVEDLVVAGEMLAAGTGLFQTFKLRDGARG